MRRVLVVGNGMVGLRFVQDLLERDPDRELAITVVGAEKGGAYNRLLLSNVLAGTSRLGDVELADEDWYAGQGVELRSGRTVVELDRVRRQARLDDGATVGYDVAVLATGSDAVIPPIANLREPADRLRAGVAAFRTLEDCAEITARARQGRTAVVVGGGLLGIEAARGLVGLGLRVTVVQRSGRLMDAQLDTGASRVLTRALQALGVEVVTDAGIDSVAAAGDGAVAGLRLADGRLLDADLLVLCCGVRPNVALAEASGLAVGRGVIVGDDLRTADPYVYAIGECAEHRGTTYGLVAPGWEQARIVADRLTGTPVAYPGSAVVTRLKAAGVELAAMGESCVDDLDDVCFVDARRGVYQKVVVREGRLVGAILLGDTRHAGTLTQLFDRGTPVAPDRAAQLLLHRAGTTAPAAASPIGLPAGATVCHCNGVTKAAICTAFSAGARSVPELAARTRATTGCGSCRDVVEGLTEWLAKADPATVEIAEPA